MQPNEKSPQRSTKQKIPYSNSISNIEQFYKIIITIPKSRKVNFFKNNSGYRKMFNYFLNIYFDCDPPCNTTQRKACFWSPKQEESISTHPYRIRKMSDILKIHILTVGSTVQKKIISLRQRKVCPGIPKYKTFLSFRTSMIFCYNIIILHS